MKVDEARARLYGEVLTPSWLVGDLLKEVQPIVEDSQASILDLCAGPGTFILAIAQARLDAVTEANFKDILFAYSNLYAVELLLDNVLTCRQSLLDLAVSHLATMSETQKTILGSVIQANVIQADILQDAPAYPFWDVTSDGEVYEKEPSLGDKFSLVISNPPYQKNISGSTTETRLRNHSKATPIYQHFYEYARALAPLEMLFIIPAKWYAGGWGLNKWRDSVLAESKIHKLVDYRDSNFIFPNTEVNGGVCWLHWKQQKAPLTQIERYDRVGKALENSSRPLREEGADFFIRDHQALSILNKVGSLSLPEGRRFSDFILGTTPFGFNSNYSGYSEEEDELHTVKLFYIKRREFWVTRESISNNASYVDEWKIFLSLSHNQHSQQKIGTPHVFGPGTVCTHSYVTIVGFRNKQEAENCTSYMKTKLFRYLVGQLKISPIATRQVYRLIPVQDWTMNWTDGELYKKYGLTEKEIQHIEENISSMI